MYSLDINFLKERHAGVKPNGTDTGTQQGLVDLNKQVPLFIGLGLLLLLPGIAGGLLLLLNFQTAQTQQKIQELEAELGRLGAQSQSIQELEKQINTINEENKSLVSVFNQIKPWSAILQDIRDQIPGSVQVSSIKQADVPATGGGGALGTQLTLTGYARTYDDVNDFLLALQGSPFLKAEKTKLESATLGNFPAKLKGLDGTAKDTAVNLNLPQSVQYTISTELTSTPASQLLPQLASKGAIGLVTRIRTLEQKGAIQP
jgi:type IV pilus assembly protein PilN